MNDIGIMIIAFVTGAALGVLFFGGLWITVKKAVTAKIPALWFFGSFILRISITLSGFYLIGAKNWQRLILCLLGFMIARFVVLRVTKNQDAKQLNLKKKEIYGA
ncbi:MAG: ATP synthase subunit I [Leeuwenhoekiella sp.]